MELLKEKREIIRPVLMKFGLALAISLGGVVYTFVKIRRIEPSKSKPSPGNRSKGNSTGECGGLRDDDLAFRGSPLRKTSSLNSISGRSSGCRRSVDREGLLLPEFNEVVKECSISERKNVESLTPEAELHREHKCGDHDVHELEIKKLRGKVKTLEERERKLEVQLLEYYGIKEQENAVYELQNRLRLNNVEAKLYTLKIDSLLSDNRRLEAQVAEYAHVLNELEAAKAKIKQLRKKLKSEGEQNREQILTLQDRVMKMQEQERKAVEFDQDVEMQLKEMNELKEELEETKKLNDGLKIENADLAQKLEYVKMLAASALDNEEILELKEESRRLKKHNEDLSTELEQLKAARCRNVEELVYLRWINACLRQELRSHHQAGPNKAASPNPGKALSPKTSEEIAKHLILENATKDSPGFDSDQYSQASCLTDSNERDEFCGDTHPPPLKPGKTKVFAKLKRLLRGKANPRNNTQGGGPPKTKLERAVSVDNIARYSSDSGFSVGPDFEKTTRNSSGGSSSRRSFDVPRSYKSFTGESSNCSGRTSDDGSMSILRRIDSLTEDDHDWLPGTMLRPLNEDDEALKNSRSDSFRRRSASFVCSS